MDDILLARRMKGGRGRGHLIRATISASAVVQRRGSTADLTWDSLGGQRSGGRAPLMKRGGRGSGTCLAVIRALKCRDRLATGIPLTFTDRRRWRIFAWGRTQSWTMEKEKSDISI